MKKMQALVECRNVSKSYGAHAPAVITNFNLRIEPRQVLILEGPNGSGKTTLLRLLAGSLSPSQGEIYLFGQRFTYRTHDLRRHIGVVPSGEHTFFPNATCRASLQFFGSLYGMTSRKLEKRMNTLAEQMSCSEYLDRPYQELSSGFRQRMAIIRAVLHTPKLLLLDEALNSLDKHFRSWFKSWLEEYVKDNAGAALLSSHLSDGIQLSFSTPTQALGAISQSLHPRVTQ